MKNFMRLFLFLALISGLSNAMSLLPGGDPQCLNAYQNTLEARCSSENEFFIDQNGQCGCLPKQSIATPQTCTDISPSCGESKDQVFSNLYQYRDNNGLIEMTYAGCGCFTLTTGAVSAAAAPSVEINEIVSVPCSTAALALAITNANAVGSGTLNLARSCAYTITIPATANEGLPIITGDITIRGGPSTTIRRDLAAPAFRIFTINPGAILHIEGIFVENGTTAGLGGAILNGGILFADRMTFSNNNAGNGGSISVSSGATAHIFGSLFVENSASSVGGGALMNFGTTTITNSQFRANTAPINGGGINVQPNGITTITSSNFSANTSGTLGGGLSNLGTLNLNRSLVEDNTGSSGGGIATGSPNVSLIDSEVSHNNPDNCSPLNTISSCVN